MRLPRDFNIPNIQFVTGEWIQRAWIDLLQEENPTKIIKMKFCQIKFFKENFWKLKFRNKYLLRYDIPSIIHLIIGIPLVRLKGYFEIRQKTHAILD